MELNKKLIAKMTRIYGLIVIISNIVAVLVPQYISIPVLDEENIEFEDLRHKISTMISAVYGSEENPLVCEEPIIIGEDEAQGLNDAEKAKVVSMFHDQEGIIWFNLENVDKSIEINKLTLNDVKKIYNELL